MKLYIKQKVFSWTDTYEIFDEEGEVQYSVDSEFFSLGHRLHVKDNEGNEVALIKEKIISMLPCFEIQIGGKTVEKIQKKFSFLNPKYEVDFCGWRVEGNIMGWEYDVYEGCSPAVHISKKKLSWADTYSLEFYNPEDELNGLLLVVAIDASNCTKKEI